MTYKSMWKFYKYLKLTQTLCDTREGSAVKHKSILRQVVVRSNGMILCIQNNTNPAHFMNKMWLINQPKS